MTIDFKHNQTAHCESGVLLNLLKYKGVEITEPLIFGIGSGLFFGYLPFIKVNHIPLTTFRHLPGKIYKQASKEFGIKIKKKTFRNQKNAMDALDELIQQGIPAGVQVGVFWLPYFPSAYRFHFNAHNIVVYGKENQEYLVSDPNIEHPARISYDNLLKARFAQGPLSPSGNLYYLIDIPGKIDFKKPVINGIKKTCFNMLNIPIPILGVRGIRYLAKRIKTWQEKLGEKQAALHLGQLIRMQEEIGTGGAGFRFIFASFLQEAAIILKEDKFFEMSEEMTQTGDKWREFALIAARILKNRVINIKSSYEELSEILFNCSDREEKIYKKLKVDISKLI